MWWFLFLLSAPFDPNAQMPTGKEDFSAFRVDTEVWGWDKKYTEMATTVQEVARARDGEIEGEWVLMVFPVGSSKPMVNVSQAVITQGARPYDPGTFPDIIDMLSFTTGYDILKEWPMRPKYKYPKGAMKVETIWTAIETEPGVCAAAIGFLMNYRGQTRYQPHELMKMKASCAHLHLSNQRLYWAKNDLAAAMPRFDYSPNDNEYSIRFPISVVWQKGVPLKIQLKTTDKNDVYPFLKKYGAVTKIVNTQLKGQIIYYKPEYLYLAKQMADHLKYDLIESVPSTLFDIEIYDGLKTETPPEQPRQQEEQPTPQKNSEFLENWSP